MFSSYLRLSLLNSYSGMFSSLRKNILLKKLKNFNRKHLTSFWLEIEQVGLSDQYVILAMRTGGVDGKIVYVKKLRGELRDIFSDKIRKITKEMKNQEVSKQELQDGLQLEIIFP